MLDKSNMSTQVVLIHPVHQPMALLPRCSTPLDACIVYLDVQNIGLTILKLTNTIESMLDKIQMSTQMSFNTSCISTDGAAAELQHPAGFLRSIHQMSDILDGLC